LKRPDLFDIRCVRCTPRNDTKYPCDRYRYDADLNDALQNLNAIKGEYVEHTSFVQFKHVINLPGSTSGSYSRNLNTLWALGSIVFLWQSSHVEWYYPGLIEGITHLTVNKSNAIEILQTLGRNPQHIRRLLRGAQFVTETYMCADCLATFLRDTISAFVKTFHLGELLQSQSHLLSFFHSHAINCSELELVEFYTIDDSHSRQCTFRDLSKFSCSELLDYAFDRRFVATTALPPLRSIDLEKKHSKSHNIMNNQ